MIKVIATDLDGTLMAADHMTVSARNANALKTAHEKGVTIAIATGRPLCIITNVVEQIPFVDYIISANGAAVFDAKTNECIYSTLIDKQTSKKAIDILLEYETFYELYIGGKSHYQIGTEKIFQRSDSGLPLEFIDSIIPSMTGHKDIIKELDGCQIEKITMYSVADKDFDKLKHRLQNIGLSIASSLPHCLEATSSVVNKGLALKSICDKVGATSLEAMAFGDAGNDCDMLSWAEYSFAMQNATDECKSSAKFITVSNVDDGVGIEIEKYVL